MSAVYEDNMHELQRPVAFGGLPGGYGVAAVDGDGRRRINGSAATRADVSLSCVRDAITSRTSSSSSSRTQEL
jgi:hypothetical protein